MTLHEILDRLLPCKHKWKTIEITKVYPIDILGNQIGKLPEHSIYTLECKVCGNITKRRI
jgi:hypothetical protein